MSTPTWPELSPEEQTAAAQIDLAVSSFKPTTAQRILAAAAQINPRARPRVDPKASLADDFVNHRCVDPDDPYDVAVARDVISRAKRYVFDQAAADMASALAGLPPLQLAKLLDACKPASSPVWIEMPVHEMFNDFEHGPSPGGRCALLAEWATDGGTHCMLIHHLEPPVVRWWPSGFLMAHEGKPYLKSATAYTDELKNGLWGFDYEPGTLHGRAKITLHPTVVRQHKKNGEMVTIPAGWTRFAIAALTILNSRSVEVSEPVRPAGQRLIGGKSRPYASLIPLRISLPRRVRNRAAYLAREAIAEHARRCLHEVSPHYRHLTHQPKTPGWLPVEIDGTIYWRKRIEAHLRGDPDLGVVEHDVTMVHGAHP